MNHHMNKHLIYTHLADLLVTYDISRSEDCSPRSRQRGDKIEQHMLNVVRTVVYFLLVTHMFILPVLMNHLASEGLRYNGLAVI
jgi:hypothetical protein